MIPLFLTDARYYDERGRPPCGTRVTGGRRDRERVLLVISALAVAVRAASRRRNNRVACGRVS